MQAVAGHDVGGRAEDVADETTNTHELDQTELRIVVIEEQIDIAVRPRVASRCRAEEIERCHTLAAQGIGMCR